MQLRAEWRPRQGRLHIYIYTLSIPRRIGRAMQAAKRQNAGAALTDSTITSNDEQNQCRSIDSTLAPPRQQTQAPQRSRKTATTSATFVRAPVQPRAMVVVWQLAEARAVPHAGRKSLPRTHARRVWSEFSSKLAGTLIQTVCWCCRRHRRPNRSYRAGNDVADGDAQQKGMRGRWLAKFVAYTFHRLPCQRHCRAHSHKSMQRSARA